MLASGGVSAADKAAAPASQPAPLDRAARLDDLFAKLKSAKDSAEGKSLIAQIERIWSRSGSDTVDLLMVRVSDAIGKQDTDLALDLLDSALALDPDWAEGWNRRATVLFLRRDLDGSMRDIREVLVREPRHFGAWAGMGLIFLQLENKKRALAAFQKALEFDPWLDSARESVEKLSKDLDGSPA